MQRFFVEEFLLRNEDYLFLNDETREELIEGLSALPDEYQTQLDNFPFKNPQKAKLIATFFGKKALQWFYLEDTKEGFLKKYFSAYKISFKKKEKKDAQKLCREYNTQKLFQMANDPSTANRLHRNNEIAKIVLSTGMEVGKDLAKNSKDLEDSFTVKYD